MKLIIIFLIRKKLGLKKYQVFRFANQKSNAFYWFTNNSILKSWHGNITPSGVSLNWLLDNECFINKLGPLESWSND